MNGRYFSHTVLSTALLLSFVAGSGLVRAQDALLTVPAGAAGALVDPAATPTRNPRVILVTQDDCAECEIELSRLRLSNGIFDTLARQRWKIGDTSDCHIQIVNRKKVPDLVAQLRVQTFPTVACLHNGQIIRSFTEGCRTPLDEWTFGWLLHGRDERTAPLLPEDISVDWTGHYPLRGNHWSVEGEWIPSYEYLLEHLRGDNHESQIPSNWPIDNWSYEELRSLHDDVHENDGVPLPPLKTYRRPPPLPEPFERSADNAAMPASAPLTNRVAPTVPKRFGKNATR